MSFRNRLTLFFIFIVIVPMIAVALVLFQLVGDSDDQQLDVRLDQAQRAAQGLDRSARSEAQAAGRRIGSDAPLAVAIAAREPDAVRERLAELAAATQAERLRADLDGLGRFDVGGSARRRLAVAPATSRLVDAQGRAVGSLQVSIIGAREHAVRVELATGLPVVLDDGATLLYASPAVNGARSGRDLPREGVATLGGDDYRVTTLRTTGFDGRALNIRNLVGEADADSTLDSDSVLVVGALVGFLLLAFAFALAVSRALRRQVQHLLEAARRLAAGDFHARVAPRGNDEFAALGSEFNAMAGQLELRLEELQTERGRLQGAMRRVGDSFAKGLDRDALLDIVVDTVVDGIGADCGRATVLEEGEREGVEVARAGDPSARLEAIRAVERTAIDSGAPAEFSDGQTSALAQPLRASDGDGVLGVISVARAGRPFTAPDQELFAYLANQAAVSIENVDLHETVQRQAVTDELTGLFNHRRFQEVMALEVERTRRFGSDMGLVMFDLDDFKQVNDRYGHLQGDMVLREVAAVLRESAREVDEPARYGGEEMAVALPGTDLQGAYRFAERVRRRIEALDLPVLDGDGSLRVTASFGVAALVEAGPSRDADKEALVAAADAAMYEAKRSGKNRTVKAG